jgi:hypothetical protein
MNAMIWPRVAAKVFGVLATSTGIGFMAGAITYGQMGRAGMIYNSAVFGHVADIVGWGAGLLAAGLLTFGMLWAGGRRDQNGKPAGIRDLH